MQWPRDPALTPPGPRAPEYEAGWITLSQGSLQGVLVPAAGKARTLLGTADLLGLTILIWAFLSQLDVSEALR